LGDLKHLIASAIGRAQAVVLNRAAAGAAAYFPPSIDKLSGSKISSSKTQGVTMQLVYRGVPYESQAPSLEASLIETQGVYRGVRSIYRTAVSPASPTRGLQLHYRGISYTR
jgi:Domain of unknown function (DUF4278)